MLIGPNYVALKHNLDIVLTFKGHKFVLTKACPNIPTFEASQEEKQRYDHWLNSQKAAFKAIFEQAEFKQDFKWKLV